MSYARSPGEGDVYVVGVKSPSDAEMHIECMGCDLLPAVRKQGLDIETETGSLIPTGEFFYQKQTFVAADPRQMLAHLSLHVAAGQQVPERAFRRLGEEHVAHVLKRQQEFEALQAEAKKRLK